MSKTDELKKLFEDWQSAQKAETEEEFGKYEKRENVCKESFDPDGIISEEDYLKLSDKKILFIAKEGNVGGNSPNNKVHKADNDFWLQRVVSGEYKQTLFSKRLALLCNAFCDNDFTVVNKKHNSLKGAAFMNLNKRGGYRYCDWNVLSAYTERYSGFIRREIEIITPDLIVCCGRGVKYLIDEFVKPSLSADARIVEVYHPSYFKIGDKDYLRQFATELTVATAGSSQIEVISDDELCTDAQTNPEIRGFIFDTNAKNNLEATSEMLCCVPLAKISAFGKAGNNTNELNIGDYVFYYLKKVGIIAVGKVVGSQKNSRIRR